VIRRRLEYAVARSQDDVGSPAVVEAVPAEELVWHVAPVIPMQPILGREAWLVLLLLALVCIANLLALDISSSVAAYPPPPRPPHRKAATAQHAPDAPRTARRQRSARSHGRQPA
jgi:hypothetical protein